PFFTYLSHYAVHLPLEAPDSLVQKYEEKLSHNPTQKSAIYAAMIENVDKNVGLLLDELDDLGLTENTVVIFYSDNGGESEATNNSPLRAGKGYLYEGGIRVPLMIKWPGRIVPNSTSDVPVISDDIFPTIMSIVGKGVVSPQDIDGISLTPILLGEKKSIKRDQLC